MIDIPIGQALKAIRIQRGMSRHDVELKTGLLCPYQSRFENGVRAPSLATIARLAEGYGTTAWAIVKFAEKAK